MAQFTCSICGDGFEQKSRVTDSSQKNILDDEYSNAIFDVINRLPNKEYSNMTDVEKSIGSIA